MALKNAILRFLLQHSNELVHDPAHPAVYHQHLDPLLPPLTATLNHLLPELMKIPDDLLDRPKIRISTPLASSLEEHIVALLVIEV